MDVSFLAGQIAGKCNTGTGLVSAQTANAIVSKYLDEIISIVWEDADHDNFNGDDVQIAITTVICNHLGLEL
jgi:hypothetical protein